MTRWLLAAGLTALLFADAAGGLGRRWAADPNYGYAWAVPPMAAALARRAWRRAGPPGAGEAGPGAAAVAAGAACALLAAVLAWPPLAFLGVLAVGRGLLVAGGGRAWAGRFTGPLLILGLAFPLPAAWTAYAGLWLQDVVSRLTEAVVGLVVVCHRAGHTLRLAGVDESLTVAAECSGFAQVVAFVALAVVAGELRGRPAWHRLALVLAAAPVAVLANTARVVLMNFGVYQFGAGWTHGPLHDAPALVCVPAGVAAFLLIDRLLAGRPVPPRTSDAPGSPRMRAALVALAAGAVGRVALSAHLAAAGPAEYPAPAGRLEALPLAVGGWAGTDLPAEREAVRGRLPFAADDLALRAYRGPGGAVAQVYAVASAAGADRLHHPEICVRDVGGAAEDLGFRAAVPFEAGSARRFRFRVAGRPVVVYYWHYAFPAEPAAGRTWLQAVHHRATAAAPSLTVQVAVPAAAPDIEAGLLPALDAALRRTVLPAGVVAAGDRLPIGLASD